MSKAKICVALAILAAAGSAHAQPAPKALILEAAGEK
jgi:hypothetical protein